MSILMKTDLTTFDKYQVLYEKYSDVGLDAEESVDLVQYLLDTDLINSCPELELLSQYYVLEGLCYEVGVS
jgi:hypothetical protein